MQKISGPGATPTNEFSEGNPTTGQEATIVSASWLNTVQRELVAVCAAAGLALDANNDAQVAAAIQILGGGTAANAARNLLLNPGFEIFQRLPGSATIAVTNAGAYTLDRWHARADALGSGTGAATVSRQAFTTGQTDVPGNPKNHLRYTQGTASSVASPSIAQRVEDVTRFADGSLTFSVYLKGSGALAGTLKLTQVFGTGGSPSTAVVVATQGVSISTGWQRFSVSVNLTSGGFSMVGKTLGSNGDSHLLVEILLPQGSASWTIDVANAQLERNGQATTFIGRDPGEDLRQCMRYFQRSGVIASPVDSANQAGALFGNVANAGSNLLLEFSRAFPVPMRKTPTMVWRNPLDGVANTLSWGTARTVSSTANASERMTGYPVCATAPTTGTLTLAIAHYEADAEI